MLQGNVIFLAYKNLTRDFSLKEADQCEREMYTLQHNIIWSLCQLF